MPPVVPPVYAISSLLQVVDDILDITATTEELGKTAGKDLASAKTTYPSLVGLERSREVRPALAAAGRWRVGCCWCCMCLWWLRLHCGRVEGVLGVLQHSCRLPSACACSSENTYAAPTLTLPHLPVPLPACPTPLPACLPARLQIADELIEEAKSMLTTYDPVKAAPLYALAEYIRSRKN